MRGEIIKRDEQIAALSKQVNSPFVPYEIYSEEKMQYVVDGLTRAKIPFIEESRLLYIPEYAVKTANVISSHYKPANGGTIREQIALDIDRLIYTSSSVENLLNKLKERGYEIKQGKYLAVKAPFAERFVRLKSLGEDYLPKMLEKRISSNGTYVRKVRERMSRSNEVEKKICAMVLETSVAIQQFRIIPKKTKPQKTYTLSNDDNLNLYHYGAIYNKSEYIFTQPDGRLYRPDCVTRSFQRALKRHNLPEMRFHDLRHSTASILFDKGWDLESVKAWLRHADIETTSNIYLHISKGRKHLLYKDMTGTFIAPHIENIRA